MNFLKKIFSNDWLTIEVITAKYTTSWTNENGFKTREDDKHTTFYNIQYSKSKNKSRLRIDGLDSEAIIDSKIKAIGRVAELNKLLLTNKIEDIISPQLSTKNIHPIKQIKIKD